MRCLTLTVMCIVYSSLMLSCARATPSGEWRFYASDAASTKFSSLEQIDATNVGRLRVAWRWVSIDENLRVSDAALWTWKNEATPLMAGRTLYVSTSLSQVAALNPVSGRTKWIYDPETYKAGSPPGGGFVHRGLALWEDAADRRIIIVTGDAYLIALDAATGKHRFATLAITDGLT